MIPLTKKFYSTPEVEKIVGVSRPTIYKWENEFSQLSPKIGPGTRKKFTPDDVRLCATIRELTCVRGLSIAETRDYLDKTYRLHPRRKSFVCESPEKAVKLLDEAIAMSDADPHILERLKAVMEWIQSGGGNEPKSKPASSPSCAQDP